MIYDSEKRLLQDYEAGHIVCDDIRVKECDLFNRYVEILGKGTHCRRMTSTLLHFSTTHHPCLAHENISTCYIKCLINYQDRYSTYCQIYQCDNRKHEIILILRKNFETLLFAS